MIQLTDELDRFVTLLVKEYMGLGPTEIVPGDRLGEFEDLRQSWLRELGFKYESPPGKWRMRLPEEGPDFPFVPRAETIAVPLSDLLDPWAYDRRIMSGIRYRERRYLMMLKGRFDRWYDRIQKELIARRISVMRTVETENIVTDPVTGLRTLNGWPEWSPGIFGPVPISIVDAVREGRLRYNPSTGFYDPIGDPELIRVWEDASVDDLHDAGALLVRLDPVIRFILTGPALDQWKRLYGDFQESRLPLGVAATILGALVGFLPRCREIARKLARAVPRVRTLTPTVPLGLDARTIAYFDRFARGVVVPEIRAGAGALERAAGRLLGAQPVGARAATGFAGRQLAGRAKGSATTEEFAVR